MTDATFAIARKQPRASHAPAVPAVPKTSPPWRLARSLAAAVPHGAARFLVAGAMASALNWLVRFPLSAVLPFGVAVGVAYGFGMTVGFVLYRAWVFPGSPVPFRHQVLRFLGVNAVGVAVVVTAAQALAAAIGWLAVLPPAETMAVAHAVAIVLGAFVNFAGHRALTFSRRAPPPLTPLPDAA